MDKVDNKGIYSVQVGAYRNEAAAKSVARPLMMLGYPVRIMRENDLYYVLVGNFTLLSEATELESDLRALGYDTIIKKVEVEELPEF